MQEMLMYFWQDFSHCQQEWTTPGTQSEIRLECWAWNWGEPYRWGRGAAWSRCCRCWECCFGAYRHGLAAAAAGACFPCLPPPALRRARTGPCSPPTSSARSLRSGSNPPPRSPRPQSPGKRTPVTAAMTKAARVSQTKYNCNSLASVISFCSSAIPLRFVNFKTKRFIPQ